MRMDQQWKRRSGARVRTCAAVMGGGAVVAATVVSILCSGDASAAPEFPQAPPAMSTGVTSTIAITTVLPTTEAVPTLLATYSGSREP